MGTLQLDSLREPETAGDLREFMQVRNAFHYQDQSKVRKRFTNLVAWEFANIKGQLLDTFRANRKNGIADHERLPDDIRSNARRMLEIMSSLRIEKGEEAERSTMTSEMQGNNQQAGELRLSA